MKHNGFDELDINFDSKDTHIDDNDVSLDFFDFSKGKRLSSSKANSSNDTNSPSDKTEASAIPNLKFNTEHIPHATHVPTVHLKDCTDYPTAENSDIKVDKISWSAKISQDISPVSISEDKPTPSTEGISIKPVKEVDKNDSVAENNTKSKKVSFSDDFCEVKSYDFRMMALLKKDDENNLKKK